MNGELVQIVGLTWQANAALAGATVNSFSNDPTVRLCDSITFVVMKRSALGGFKEHRVAASSG
jgi:hypothetical protein